MNINDMIHKVGGRYGGPGRIVGVTNDLDSDGYRLYNVAMKVADGYGEFVHVFPAAVLSTEPDPRAGSFRPGVTYGEDSNMSQMLLADCPTVTGYPPVIVEPLYRMGDRTEIVGFQWYGRTPTVASELDRLRTALEWYANPANYIDAQWDDGSTDGCDTPNAIPAVVQDGVWVCDCGDIARAALGPEPTT